MATLTTAAMAKRLGVHRSVVVKADDDLATVLAATATAAAGTAKESGVFQFELAQAIHNPWGPAPLVDTVHVDLIITSYP